MRVAVIGHGRMGREVEAALLERGHEPVIVPRVSEPSPYPPGAPATQAAATRPIISCPAAAGDANEDDDATGTAPLTELEPNEAEHIPVPFFRDLQLDFAALDRLERAGNIEAILDITDAELLQNRLGFDAKQITTFRRIWRKLSGRRVGRKS